MKTRILALLAVGTLGCGVLYAYREPRPDGPENDMVTTAQVSSNAPLLDREVPARIESATFALG